VIRLSSPNKSKLDEQLDIDLKRIEAQIRLDLFGSVENENRNYSLNQLISIRQEWDNFLSNSSKAESVPINWVFINEQTNDDKTWSNYIINTNL
jgi:hypothetical protein